MHTDTIVAVATAAGPSAIAVVRLSGPEAFAVAAILAERFDPARAREARLLALRDREGPFDRSVVTAFSGPRSFTGEDVVEFSCHGGALTAGRVVAACVEVGAREAHPGEFTRRAVLNGKLDLLQAEATGDLLMATSPAQAAQALAQLDGNLSRRIDAMREALLHAEALLAYTIDFPEEDDGPIPTGRVRRAVETVREQLQALLATSAEGERLRAGALVVLVGAPNAGKSSLFNALLGRDRALVSEIPGTTRDAIESVTTMGGYPVRLVDTAGMRSTEDHLEGLGMEHSRRWLQQADLVLECVGPDQTLSERSFTSVCPVLTVATKSDLGVTSVEAACAVSVITGAGLEQLREMVRLVLTNAAKGARNDPNEPQLTRARHSRAVRQAIAAADRALDQLEAREPVLAASDLRDAAASLEAMVGGVDREDVLDSVFAGFCIGK